MKLEDFFPQVDEEVLEEAVQKVVEKETTRPDVEELVRAAAARIENRARTHAVAPPPEPDKRSAPHGLDPDSRRVQVKAAVRPSKKPLYEALADLRKKTVSDLIMELLDAELAREDPSRLRRKLAELGYKDVAVP